MVNLVGKILKVFADNDLFDEGIELIGSWCFQMYVKHLGAKSFPLRTQDIDFLVPNPFYGKEHPNFIKQLESLGFACEFKRDGSLYLWNADLKIEFITPEKGRGVDGSIRIKKLGLSAIPLRFVMLLLDKPIKLKDEGIDISLPNPVNFCLHKLIIASRRRTIDKSIKDLQQAICTSTIVEAKEINALFVSLPRKWKQSILNMLEKSKNELPLHTTEIAKLEDTLQIGNK